MRFSDQPIAYEKLAKTVIYLLVGFTIVHWSDAQIVLVLAVIEAFLGLFVWRNTVTVKEADKQAAEAVTIREAQIDEFLTVVAEVAPPVPAKKVAAAVKKAAKKQA